MTPPKTPVWIHAGLAKTGTTTLQAQLFPCHPQVHFMGVFHGEAPPGKVRCSKWTWRDKDSAQVGEAIMDLRESQAAMGTFRPVVERILAQAASLHRIVVFSAEGLSLKLNKKAENQASKLCALFPQARILVVIRRPVDLVRSAYSQYLKREFVRRAGILPRVLPINEWAHRSLDDCGRAPFVHLRYAETIRVFEAVYGEDSVSVAAFEDLCRQSGGLLPAVCRILSIDDTWGSQLTRDRANQGLTDVSIGYLQSLNRSWFSRLRFNLAGFRKRKEILVRQGDKARNPDLTHKAQKQLDDALLERIHQMTAEGNRRLAARRGLPLEELGYPI